MKLVVLITLEEIKEKCYILKYSVLARYPQNIMLQLFLKVGAAMRLFPGQGFSRQYL